MMDRMSDERLAEIRRDSMEYPHLYGGGYVDELLAEVERLRAFEDAARPLIAAAIAEYEARRASDAHMNEPHGPDEWDAWLPIDNDLAARHAQTREATHRAVRAYREAQGE